MNQLSLMLYLMEMFPLFQLPRAILEKIITKLEWKSYFRLQQTCRDVEELVRTSRSIRNITVPVNYGFFLRTVLNTPLRLCCGYHSESIYESPYGVRFTGLTVEFDKSQCNSNCSNYPGELSPWVYLYDSIFENYCNSLKKYRITCREVNLSRPSCLTKEECVTLFNILKPVDVNMYSRGTNQMEALLETKTLKAPQFSVDLDQLLERDLFKQFLLKFPSVEIRLFSVESSPPVIDLLLTLLQFLRSEPLSHLRQFALKGDYQTRTQFYSQELRDAFSDYINPIRSTSIRQAARRQIQRPTGERKLDFTCRLGRNGYCKLFFHWSYGGGIDYRLWFKRKGR